jgi:hypothetical protein
MHQIGQTSSKKCAAREEGQRKKGEQKRLLEGAYRCEEETQDHQYVKLIWAGKLKWGLMRLKPLQGIASKKKARALVIHATERMSMVCRDNHDNTNMPIVQDYKS